MTTDVKLVRNMLIHVLTSSNLWLEKLRAEINANNTMEKISSEKEIVVFSSLLTLKYINKVATNHVRRKSPITANEACR